jgi:predicted AlkP superfamily pyrophosphatase or phosphodiesterase
MRVVVVSIPQLRNRDVTPGALRSLESMVGRGGMADFTPAFPSLAAPSFATLVTGVGASRHGMVGDAYYDRIERHVAARPFPDSAVQAPKLWEHLHASRPGSRSLSWFTPNLAGAAIDLAAWVDPAAGLLTQPPELANALANRFGPYPFPRQDPTGEPLHLAATAWILRTAAATIAAERPDLALVRVPYLGQVARRYGPDGREAGRAVRELEPVLAPFLAAVSTDALTVVVSESVSTPVTGPVYPNRILRRLGLVSLEPAPGGGSNIDIARSAGFAVADHQVCQIYLNDSAQAATVAATFSGPRADGVATVACGAHRAALGLDHPRAGDIVLVARADRWFAPNWWDTHSERPARGSPLSSCGAGPDTARVLGSLGAPPPNDDYLGVIIASMPHFIGDAEQVAARDLPRLLKPVLGIGT